MADRFGAYWASPYCISQPTTVFCSQDTGAGQRATRWRNFLDGCSRQYNNVIAVEISSVAAQSSGLGLDWILELLRDQIAPSASSDTATQTPGPAKVFRN